ncbi:MAG: hypothetical protein KJZ69_19485 [Phycisphaerales bacterium]|nr:hypothetical protein [Phycisphaerales bacterium]
MEVEYAWLTSAARSRNFFGPGDGLHTAFLLRHGVCTWRGVFEGVTLDEWGKHVRDGNCCFYLAAVEAGGKHLELGNTFFMVDATLFDAIVLGDGLFHRLRQQCSFSGGHVASLDSGHVFAHVWPYALPPVDEDHVLYRQVHDVLGLDEPPGSDELMRRLCSCWPAPFELPPMHLILAPALLKHTGVRMERRGGRIVLSMSRDSRVRTAQGEVAATPEYFRSDPIVKYDGFLVPHPAAALFATGRECAWPAIDCITDVVLEW